MRSTQPQSNQQNTAKSRTASRTVLLGSAAMIAAVGIFGAAQVIPFNTAVAETATVRQQAFPSFANVIEQVRGAVVSVKVTIADAGNTTSFGQYRGQPMPNIRPGDPLERFFNQFGNRGNSSGAVPRSRVRRSQGSGFVITADGYVVTNNHVVKHAKKVKLTFDNGKSVDANVVGRDEKTDLALLKISQPGNYKFVKFAKTLPRIGDWVVAIGNPFGLGGTVTAGIVSARGRDIGSGPYDDFLQIDAPVNRGNSGGPTFDSNGNVVGVNTAIYSPSGGSVGIGFAIPANVAENVIASLRSKGSVSRGYIGVQIQPITRSIAESMGVKERTGALVAAATPGLPADKAGIRSGDIIVSVNGVAVSGPRELARKIAALAPGAKAEIGYLRQGKKMVTSLSLADQPNSRQAALPDRDTPPRRALTQRFGMTLAPAGDVAGATGSGVVVAEIDPSGLAARQGLRSGDVIIEVAGKKVSNPEDFKNYVSMARKAGRKAVLIRVKSGTTTRFLALAFRSKNAG